MLVFPCSNQHVTCLDCFRQYCVTRLRERQYVSHPKYGYTLPCPAECENSVIEEAHHFHVLNNEEVKYLKKNFLIEHLKLEKI